MSDQLKYAWARTAIPRAWYNIVADLPAPPPPVLHPGTGEPIGRTTSRRCSRWR